MKNLSGKLIVFVYCMAALLFVPMDAQLVAGCFGVVAVSCLMEVYPGRKAGAWLGGCYLVSGFFFPALCVFFPVLVYDFVRQKNWPFVGISLCLTAGLWLPENWRVGIYLLMGCGIAAFLSWQMTTQLRLEAVLKKTQDDSKEKNLLLSEKNRHLIESQNQEIYTATLKERNRIAREIHDHVGHMLSRSILIVGALKAINQQENINPSLNQLEETLHLAMNNVRESVHDLHDDSVDLQSTMEELAGEFTKCPCELEYDMGRMVPNEIKYTFIAIVKEALANITKHSDATSVNIRLREHPGLYQLRVEDNGSVSAGSLKAENLSAQGGMGLTNMRDRVAALHGNIQFHTEQGFHIFITIPKGEKNDDENRDRG